MKDFFDLAYCNKGIELVVGCDEVGRGPLAGPVVGAAVGVNCNCISKTLKILDSLGITDSKKISKKRRVKILSSLGIDTLQIDIDKRYQLTSLGITWSIAECSSTVIDKINILQASLQVMYKASERVIEQQHAAILIDGNKTFAVLNHCYQESVIKGDSKSLLIGLASIIAKEYRDFKMAQFAALYPEYGLEQHAGYPTVKHREAIAKYGPSPIHRRSFKGVKEFC